MAVFNSIKPIDVTIWPIFLKKIVNILDVIVEFWRIMRNVIFSCESLKMFQSRNAERILQNTKALVWTFFAPSMSRPAYRFITITGSSRFYKPSLTDLQTLRIHYFREALLQKQKWHCWWAIYWLKAIYSPFVAHWSSAPAGGSGGSLPELKLFPTSNIR